jgi:hypothetical protein
MAFYLKKKESQQFQTIGEEDITNLYQKNNGYLFSNILMYEVKTVNDKLSILKLEF